MDIIVGDMYYLKPGSKSWGDTDLSQYKTAVVVAGPYDDGDVDISVADDSHPDRPLRFLVPQDRLSRCPWDKFADSPWIKTPAPKQVSDLKVGELIEVDNCSRAATTRTVAAIVTDKDGREYVVYRWDDGPTSGVAVAMRDRVKKPAHKIQVGDEIIPADRLSSCYRRVAIGVHQALDTEWVVYLVSGSPIVHVDRMNRFKVKESN